MVLQSLEKHAHVHLGRTREQLEEDVRSNMSHMWDMRELLYTCGRPRGPREVRVFFSD